MSAEASRPHVLVNHLNEPPNRITGITKYTFELLKELIRGDAYTYTLMTTWDESALPDGLRDPALRVVTAPHSRSAPLGLALQTLRTPIVARRVGADLIFHPTPLGSFLDRLPRVVTVHDLYYELVPEDYPARHVGFWNFVFPKILSNARGIIAVSGATRADIERFYPSVAHKVAVVVEAGALSVDAVGEFRPPHGGPYSLFVGNLSPNKNAVTLVRALRALAERGVTPTIYHVGRDEGRMLERIQSDVPGPSIRLFGLGVLSDEDLAAAYRGATFLAAPSLREGFCLPVLEAQQFGAPVIASDIPVLREVAGDGAAYVAAGETEPLARAIERMVGDDVYRAGLSKAAVANAAGFSWRRAARETEAVFAAALRETR